MPFLGWTDGSRPTEPRPREPRPREPRPRAVVSSAQKKPQTRGVCGRGLRGPGTATGSSRRPSPGNYQRSSSDTESFLRAWRRRALRTRRPLALAMRARKPCLFTRLRREGWNVLFIISLFYIFRIRDCKGRKNYGNFKIIFPGESPVFRQNRGPGARNLPARCVRSPGQAGIGPLPWLFPRLHLRLSDTGCLG